MAQAPRRLRTMATPKKRAPKGGTSTSKFGVGKRESHDASAFYERFEAPALSGDDDVPAPYVLAEPFVEGDARHRLETPGRIRRRTTATPPFAIDGAAHLARRRGGQRCRRALQSGSTTHDKDS